jgi:hypothetical protein
MNRLVPVLLTLAASCGGRSAGVGQDGGGVPLAEAGRGSDTSRREDRGVVRSDVSLPPSACVIAIRVDSCCTQPMPAFVSNLMQDPCLVLYPPEVIPAACKAKWTVSCDTLDCTWGAPLSRLVEPIPGGSCSWKSECKTDADCVWADDVRRCCTCGEVYPKSMVAQDPCLVELYASPSDQCPDTCRTGCQPPCPAPAKPSCNPTPYQQVPLMVCGSGRR